MRAGSAWSPPWRAGGPGCHGTAGRSTLSRPPAPRLSVRPGNGSRSRAARRSHAPAAQRGARGVTWDSNRSRGRPDIIFFFLSLSSPPPPTTPLPRQAAGPGSPTAHARLDGCTDAWMHGCMDARLDGWVAVTCPERPALAPPRPPLPPPPPPRFPRASLAAGHMVRVGVRGPL